MTFTLTLYRTGHAPQIIVCTSAAEARAAAALAEFNGYRVKWTEGNA
jgi:hypothetical protein